MQCLKLKTICIINSRMFNRQTTSDSITPTQHNLITTPALMAVCCLYCIPTESSCLSCNLTHDSFRAVICINCLFFGQCPFVMLTHLPFALPHPPLCLLPLSEPSFWNVGLSNQMKTYKIHISEIHS